MRDGDIFGGGDWRERLEHIVHTMRDVSRITDPQELVATYRQRLAVASRIDGFLSVTRRGVETPGYLIARSSRWESGEMQGPANPWAQRDALPHMQGGLLGELLYGNEPRLIQDFTVEADDPAREFLEGMRSLVAIPVFDHGEALNLVVQMRRQPNAFDPENVPQMVWMTNLFSRATHGMVLSKQLAEANAELDAEHKAVGALQRSFLPGKPPRIPGLELAVHYQSSGRAGGDYYDFFPLPNGRWGVLIADVSGHGAPAAMLMAVTHALAHLHQHGQQFENDACPTDFPSRMLAWLNDHLGRRYTRDGSTFVTALYGVYDPGRRTFLHALAGHPPPRVASCQGGAVRVQSGPTGLPLGIEEHVRFQDAVLELRPGDCVSLFTDGLTEARQPGGDLFGTARMDEILGRPFSCARDKVETLVKEAHAFTAPHSLQDDLTIIIGRVT